MEPIKHPISAHSLIAYEGISPEIGADKWVLLTNVNASLRRHL